VTSSRLPVFQRVLPPFGHSSLALFLWILCDHASSYGRPRHHNPYKRDNASNPTANFLSKNDGQRDGAKKYEEAKKSLQVGCYAGVCCCGKYSKQPKHAVGST
jgi:hypothetical protein